MHRLSQCHLLLRWSLQETVTDLKQQNGAALSHTATVSCTTQSRTLNTTKPRFSSPALVLPYRTPEVKGFSVCFGCKGLCVSFSEGSVYLENTLWNAAKLKPTSILSRFLKVWGSASLSTSRASKWTVIASPCPVVTLRTPQCSVWEVKSGPSLPSPRRTASLNACGRYGT